MESITYQDAMGTSQTRRGITKKPIFEKESPDGYFYAKFNRIAPDQVTIEASGLHKPGLRGQSFLCRILARQI